MPLRTTGGRRIRGCESCVVTLLRVKWMLCLADPSVAGGLALGGGGSAARMYTRPAGRVSIREPYR